MSEIFIKDYSKLKILKGDCAKCSGLCCTALFFSKTDGFPEDKIAGKPCLHLAEDYKCRIHSQLGKRNMRGCIGYDCFGAGQQVTQNVYGGRTWRELTAQAEEIFALFLVVFQLHQIRFFLEEADLLAMEEELEVKVKKEIQQLIDENQNICNASPKEILSADMNDYRNRANRILKQVCVHILQYSGKRNRNCPSELIGRVFKGKDMGGLDLSMKLLIASDFTGCNFNRTIFLGADTRDADFSHADLSGAVFLTQAQVNAARGNHNTKLPEYLDYPVTWK